MPRQLQVDPREVVELLCQEMTEQARAEKLGIARSSYYKWINKMVQSGIIIERGKVLPSMSVIAAHPRNSRSGAHHAPVLHIWWIDETTKDKWSVQGTLLDFWGAFDGPDTVVAIRWIEADGRCSKFAFITTPGSQWSTKDTENNLHAWSKGDSWIATKNLTVAIARVLDVKAIIVPENHDAV